MKALLTVSSKYNKNETSVFIVNPKKENSHVPQSLQKDLKSFLKSDANSDFSKSGSLFTFFVKTQDAEKLRIEGYNVRSKVAKETGKIQLLSGSKNDALYLAEGLLLSNYQFLKYFKDADKRENKLKEISWIGGEKKSAQYLNNTVKAVCWSRDLVNEPLSYLTASKLAEEIAAKGKEAKFEVDIFEKKKIEALKMGGLLAVNKGSIDPPTFTILEYKPKKAKNKKPVVLVGKGVVYDTGGVSLKPTANSMDLMKSDMGGAACMVGAIYGLALNKADIHVIGLIPATDNRPGQNAYVPGDIVKMYNGLTVEVLNTDAEGRMILADALSYSAKFDPELVIDAATLTGAAVRAIGTKASCMMGNAKSSILKKIEKSGQEVHDRVVELPFWDEYGEEMKSKIADLNNLGGGTAGMITAGKFLENFVEAPYVHLDIAGPAFLTSPQDYKGVGGTGAGVRLLMNYLSNNY